MIQQVIIQHAMTALINAIPASVLVDGADRLLDLVENMIEESDTKLDDQVIIPIIKIIREAFDIPDNDPVEAMRQVKYAMLTGKHEQK